MALIPKSGTAYLIKGHIDSATIISKSDGLCWRNWGHLKDKYQDYIYHTAIPVIENDGNFESESSSVAKSKNPKSKDVSFRKVFTYDRSTSTYLIEYIGDDSEYTWKRKTYKSWRKSGKSQHSQTMQS